MNFIEAKQLLSRAQRVKPYQIFPNSGHETQWYDEHDEIAIGFVEDQIVAFHNGARFIKAEAVELLACGTEVNSFTDLNCFEKF